MIGAVSASWIVILWDLNRAVFMRMRVGWPNLLGIRGASQVMPVFRRHRHVSLNPVKQVGYIGANL